MRRDTQERKDQSQERLNAFGDWFEDRLTKLGYDLSRRGGGRGKFAEDAGVSPATVSRILLRQSIPDPTRLARMAPTLHVSLGNLLVRAGVATEDEVNTTAAPSTRDQRITPERAAELLGIDDEQTVRLFVSFTREMQRQAQQQRSGGG